MPSRPRASVLSRALRGLVISVLVLALLEGAASLLLLGYDLCRNSEPPLAERAHTSYDPELGWVSLPNVRASDLYASGVGLSTNARGFRGQREYADAVPTGATRLVCSGDSFTLGYGCGDADTWPSRLEAADARLECPNLGQGGYGVDQAYLWYLRASAGLEHDVHLFAFIADDFARMRRPSFQGYGKPVLRWNGSALELGNVPVPRPGFRWPWLSQNADLVRGSRGVQLAERASRRLTGAEPGDAFALDERAAEQVTSAIFADLSRRAREAGRLLVLVHLPMRDPGDPTGLVALSGWPARACQAAAAEGALLIDLRGEFEALPPAERAPLFLPPGAIRFPGAAGHYSAAGNAFVAAQLLRELESNAEFRASRERE